MDVTNEQLQLPSGDYFNITCHLDPRATPKVYLLKIYAIITAVFSATGSLGCLIAILLLIWSKVYKDYIHRMTLYLAIASFLEAFSVGLSTAPADISITPPTLRREWNDTCVAFAFFFHYSNFTSAFSIFWISAYVFALVTFRAQFMTCVSDVAALLFVFALPLTISWIPFIDGTFGLTTVWCWIRDRCYKGPGHAIGFQFGSSVGPLFFIYLVSMILIGVIAVKFLKGSLHKETFLRGRLLAGFRELVPVLIYSVLNSLVFLGAVFSSLYFVFGDIYHGSIAVIVVTSSMQTIRFLLPFVVLAHPSVRRKIRCSTDHHQYSNTTTVEYTNGRSDDEDETKPVIGRPH